MITKKGVSPLIATVLLIAFAVALGAVVMNWSFKYAPEANNCSNVFAKFETVQGDPDICFDLVDQQMRFTINNVEKDIDGIKVSIIGTQTSYETEINRKMGQASIQTLGIPFDATVFGKPKKLVIRPIIERSDGITVCQERTFTSEEIPDC